MILADKTPSRNGGEKGSAPPRTMRGFALLAVVFLVALILITSLAAAPSVLTQGLR